MASIKISELNEYTEVKDDDLFPIVDVANGETKKVKATNIGTGGKELIMVGDESVATSNTKLLIEQDSLNSLGTEVVDSLDGNETTMAPSVYAVNKALKTKMPNRYSTEEQVIGTWTDGKPLYRKTISINTPSTINNTEVYNFDTNFIIKNYYGFVTISASSQLLPINFYFTNEYNVTTYITKNTGKINMKIGSLSYANQQTTLTIEYTKTTD